MTNKKRDRNLLYSALFILLLVLIGIGYMVKRANYSDMQKDLLIEALQGGIKRSVDKHGQETAQKQILITTYKQLQAARAEDSSNVGILKKLVTKHTISAAVVKNHTSGKLTGKKPQVYFNNREVLPVISDTSNISENKTTQNKPCNPTFKDTLKDQWTTIIVTACKDSITADYTVKNEYEQTQTQSEKQGKWPFRYRSPVINIKNKNPNTSTDEINAWAVEVPNTKKLVTRGVIIGAAIGFVTGVFLMK